MTLAALQLEKHLPATLTAPGLSEAEFLALAEEFPDCFLEYTAEGTVLIMPPTDPDTGARVMRAAVSSCTGMRFTDAASSSEPDAGFFFPDGSRRSPDAAWFDAERWRKSQKTGNAVPAFRARVPDRGAISRSSASVASGKDGRIHRQRRAARLADRSAWRARSRFTGPAREPEVLRIPRRCPAKVRSRALFWI